MATEPTLDLATLLAPIDGADPAGIDVRLDDSPSSAYYVIKDARSAAREIEKQLANRPGAAAADGGPTPDPEWRKIRNQAPKLIAGQSKDFEVAMWLTEALLRLGGFAGLRDGLALSAALLQNFPEGVHPRPDEDGPIATVATVTALAGLQSAGALIQPLRAVWLSDCLEPGPVAYWQYLIAIDQGRGASQADLSREDFEQSVRRSTPEFLRDLKDDLKGAIDATVALQTQLDARVGRDAPSCGNIRRELETIRELVVNLVGESAEPLTPKLESEIVTDGPQTVVTKVVQQAVAVDAINNREDAFRQLLKIAEYFRKSEPHSPVAMAVEDAVRRGRMSLQDLVTELIPNEEARRMFYLSAGIKPQ
jgi:type VI secretion system protein ImpA